MFGTDYAENGFCRKLGWSDYEMHQHSYLSVRINGTPTGRIIPLRGLRQGDPLSPYLFLLCAEGLSAMLHQSLQNKKLRGVSACRRGPKVSHLFFADDNLIFGRATVVESTKILRILKVYEDSSGQQLNKEKIALYFSRNTPIED